MIVAHDHKLNHVKFTRIQIIMERRINSYPVNGISDLKLFTNISLRYFYFICIPYICTSILLSSFDLQHGKDCNAQNTFPSVVYFSPFRIYLHHQPTSHSFFLFIVVCCSRIVESIPPLITGVI